MITRSVGTTVTQYPGTSSSADAGVRRATTGFKGCMHEEATASAIASSNTRKKTVSANAGTITYDVGKHKFNYCLHVKDTFEFCSEAAGSSCTGINSSGNCTTVGFAGPWVNSSKPAYDPLASITTDMRAVAWQDLLPKLETGFSMINFLWELAELPMLFSQLSKLGQMAAILAQLKKGDSSKTLAQLLLMYGFALRPLAADLWSLVQLLGNTEKAVNDFIAEGKKLKTYHHTRIISESLVDTVGTGGVVRTRKSMVYHATLRASYSYVKPSFLDGFRRVMGLRLTPEAIWNAIPFSFLVDYVANISGWLSQFDRDTRLTVKLHDYCDSMKSTASQELVRDPRGTSFTQPSWPINVFPWGTVICRWKNSSYYRVPCLPETGFALPVWDSLSLRELVYAGALARTMI